MDHLLSKLLTYVASNPVPKAGEDEGATVS
jgi:hypothetical protein